MTGKSHKKIALNMATCISIIVMIITFDVVININSFILVPILWLPLSIAGGYAADIDKGRTTARKYANQIFKIFLVISLFLLVIFLFFTRNIKSVGLLLLADLIVILIYTSIKFMVHRRETHSILFIFLCYCVIYLCTINSLLYSKFLGVVVFNLGVGFCIGTFSHIFIDQFNDTPTHVLYPLEIILQKLRHKDNPVYIFKALKLVTTSSALEAKFIRKVKTKMWLIVILTLIFKIIITVNGVIK